ncbi:DUF4225 domain-containing protein, partial [Halomonas sp. AOP5-CZ2-32]
LSRKVVSPDSWKLFRNIRSDYVRKYETMSRGGLTVEGIGGATGIASGVENYFDSVEGQ